jgi:NADPH:quinone reductase-like Zn-dependent oxidoreductase
VVKITVAADPLQLAMLRVNPATAWLLLERVVPLSAGDWLIQNAANSALASLVIRFAREKSLRTVNLVRRRDTIEVVARSGGDVVLEAGPDLPERVWQATGGAAIKLGLDAIAGDATGAMAACMAPNGVIATYGMLSGEPCRISPHDVIARELTLVGFRLRGGRNDQSPEALQRLYDSLAQRLVAGGTFGTVRATFPLHEIHAALREAAIRTPGKILLLPNGAVSAGPPALNI